MRDQRSRIDHDEAYRDDPAFTSPEMTPGNGEDRPPRDEAEGAAGVAALGFGVAGVALAGEVERNDLDEQQDARTLDHRENHDQGVDSVR